MPDLRQQADTWRVFAEQDNYLAQTGSWLGELI